MLKANHLLSAGSPGDELEKKLKEMRGFVGPWGSNSVKQPYSPDLQGLDHQEKSTYEGSHSFSHICARGRLVGYQ